VRFPACDVRPVTTGYDVWPAHDTAEAHQRSSSLRNVPIIIHSMPQSTLPTPHHMTATRRGLPCRATPSEPSSFPPYGTWLPLEQAMKATWRASHAPSASTTRWNRYCAVHAVLAPSTVVCDEVPTTIDEISASLSAGDLISSLLSLLLSRIFK
jgi:hypothetical protein